MRIAWFRDRFTDTADPLDDSASLISELRASHHIDVITERHAHDFVWQQHLRPWDLFVYELDHTRAHEFIWAYLINYPGVLMLRSNDLAHVRVPLFASRCVVTPTAANAELLRARYPELHVRVAPPCSGPARSASDDDIGADLSASGTDVSRPRHTRFAVFDDRARGADVVRRAVRRARDAGAAFDVIAPDSPVDMLSACDVVIAPAWPPFHHATTAVLAAMAAGKTVVTMEMDATAEWPALDPQTWRPRGVEAAESPIALTIDPRDEEHSLMLAIRRLSSDAALREKLGRAGHAWWNSHATPTHAASAWAQILEEAVRLSPPPRPDDWPQQFAEDGAGLMRQILSEVGLPTALL